MGIEKKVYSFRLDEELMKRVKQQASEENRSLSNYIETVLKTHMRLSLDALEQDKDC